MYSDFSFTKKRREIFCEATFYRRLLLYTISNSFFVFHILCVWRFKVVWCCLCTIYYLYYVYLLKLWMINVFFFISKRIFNKTNKKKNQQYVKLTCHWNTFFRKKIYFIREFLNSRFLFRSTSKIEEKTRKQHMKTINIVRLCCCAVYTLGFWYRKIYSEVRSVSSPFWV